MVHFVRASALSGFPELVRSLELDPLALFEAVGIPAGALHDPEFRIRADAVGALLDMTARRTGIEDLGLRLGKDRRPSVWGPVGLLMAQQRTVGDALRAGAQLIGGHAENTHAAVETLGEETTVWIDIEHGSGEAYAYDPTQRTEMGISSAVSILRRLLHPEWRPVRVGFVHAARGNLDRYRPYFGRIPLFDQDRNAIVLLTADIDRPRPDHDPEAERIARHFAEQQLPVRGPAFSRAVALTIFQGLAGGTLSAEAVAAALELDLRTLQRRLMAEGASFSEILFKVRRDLAKTYVESSRRPLAEVADLLGFSSLSAFSQWYSRTHGVSAAERRVQSDRVGQS